MNLRLGLGIFILIILGSIAFFFVQTRKSPSQPSLGNTEVSWVFDNDTKTWQANGNPPDCPEDLKFPAPVDLSLASGILYPGQERGGDYKPHGGFRFDNRDSNEIEVRAIMDGVILKASKYLEAGEEQILFFYVNDCGVMVMHDHFLTLSPKLEEALSKLPLNQEGDSRTTNIEPKAAIKKGDVLATEIGHKNYKGQKNIFVDFGLYDLRQTNGVIYDSSFRSRFPMIDEYGLYAVCWFDYLFPGDESIVRSLPAGGHEGKVSDYCK